MNIFLVKSSLVVITGKLEERSVMTVESRGREGLSTDEDVMVPYVFIRAITLSLVGETFVQVRMAVSGNHLVAAKITQVLRYQAWVAPTYCRHSSGNSLCHSSGQPFELL